MKKIFSFALEIVRIMLILLLGLFILGFTEQFVIKLLGFTKFNWILFSISDFLLIYILYKNKLQFIGWFKSNKNIALSKQKTKYLLFVSVILFALGFIYNVIF